ncbi:nuclear transport factor 2 family protein [Cyanobacteria bacterium FACHB-63]|nr:nuclear transport factor 2 family protein [Cyanobacteria bacterium FACHB-63]
MTYTLDSARSIFPDTQVSAVIPTTVAACDRLSAEDQLALLWFAYTEMGSSITPAAMGAANMIFAEETLTQIRQMPTLQQAQVMCDLVNHTDTPICRTYSSFGMNVKLGFWYQLGEWMKQGIVAPIPQGYVLSPEASEALEAIRGLEPGQQLTVLREVVLNMGYAPTGESPAVKQPVTVPKDLIARSAVTIEGVDHPTVLSYMEAMNAFDFQAAVELFTEDGALQPPFQQPIVGRSAILTYMQEECYGLKLTPERGMVERAENGFDQIKVTGSVQTPWAGDKVRLNLAWRFLLNPEGKIFFAAIDVLASPQELLSLGLVR